MFLSLRSTFAFFAATTLLGVALLGSAPSVHAQTFNENFNGAANGGSAIVGNDPTSFTDETGTWSVNNPNTVNGTYQSVPVSNSFATINVPSVSNLANATLTFDLLNAADSGAVLRWDESTKNAIVLIVRPGTINSPGNDLYFARVTGGSIQSGQFGATTLAGTGVNTGGNYRVRFSAYSSASGDLFQASVLNISTNAVLASTSYTFATGTAPASGRGGLYQSNQGDPVNGLPSQFDNVTLQETPEPNSLLLALPALSGVGAIVVRRRRRSK